MEFGAEPSGATKGVEVDQASGTGVSEHGGAGGNITQPSKQEKVRTQRRIFIPTMSPSHRQLASRATAPATHTSDHMNSTPAGLR